MATLTFYFKDAVPSGATLHRSLQRGGTAPADATTGTGWVADHKGYGAYCPQNGGSIVPRTSALWGSALGGPSQTIGDCWRSESALTGVFGVGDWALTFGLRSSAVAYTGRFRILVNVYRCSNANGVGATLISGTTLISNTTTADLSLSADTILTAGWSAGSAITLSNEYLFAQVLISVQASGGANSEDVVFRVGSAYTVVTSDFTEGNIVTLAGQVSPTAVGSHTPASALTATGLDGTSAAGELANGTTLIGQSATGGGGLFFSGSQRAYLSWAMLSLPPPAEPGVALTGLDATSAQGDLAAGNKQAYVSWARLTLTVAQSVDLTLSGQGVGAAAGAIGGGGGSFQELTGAEATAEQGVAAWTLQGLYVVARAGTPRFIDETYIFAGHTSPSVAVNLASVGLGTALGYFGVESDGGRQQALVGFAAAAVSTTPSIDIDRELLGASAASDLTLFAFGENTQAALTTPALTLSLGTATAGTLLALVGQSDVLSDVGDFTTANEFSVIGLESTAALEPFFADQSALTGESATASAGTLTPHADWLVVSLPGQTIWTAVATETTEWSEAA